VTILGPSIYDFEISFAAVLGLRPKILRRYIRLGIVLPDAETTSGRSLFLADLASIERHRSSIRHYRFRMAAVVDNVKESSDV
jgi:hypothetical protein